MATSPIYNWPEPDNTDLVKNGALAIRTLGNAIDTTMGTMVAKTVVDAKGDLIAASAADTPARLAVGNNGETLVADSSTSTGLRYTAGNPIANPVLNSAMQVWQRGTTITTNNAYSADRWHFYAGSINATVSRQATGDTTNLPSIQYCARVQRNSGSTGILDITFTQSMESINSIPFAGKTITFSFYARVGANYSGGASGFISQVRSGTGTDQNLTVTGYTGSSSFISNTQALTTTWTRYSYTGTVPTTATELGIYTGYTPSGTAGANDYYEVTGVQIDIGSVALPFRTYAGTIQGELAACQRYYYRRNGVASSALAPFSPAYSTTGVATRVFNPQTMRVAPTSVDYSDLQLGDDVAGPATVTSVSLDGTTSPWQSTVIVGVASGLTQYRSYVLRSNTTSSYIGFSAEL
jgi:hypothetical protein